MARNIAVVGFLLALVIIAVAAGLVVTGAFGRGAPPAAAASSIGGPFTLTDTRGRTVTDAAFRGKPTAIFFGFTFCPEVCPTTLSDLTSDLQAMGADADRLNVAFVTVDPARDTPAQMGRYLSAFDRRIVGLTGTAAQIDAAERAYRVYARRQPTPDGGYTMDHSAMIYLMDTRGRFVEAIGYGETPERRRAALRRLLG